MGLEESKIEVNGAAVEEMKELEQPPLLIEDQNEN
jgi:hypothetical protein